MARLELEEIGGQTPNWAPVAPGDLSLSPWAAVCRIDVFTNGRLVARGTGWLAAGGRVITAAHVLLHPEYRATSCTLTWPGGARRESSVFKVHPGYAAGGPLRDGSAEDIAWIALATAPEVPQLPLGKPGLGPVEVAGYDGPTLVRGKGKAKVVGGFLGHDGDTLGGHSGCPILQNGAVSGVHVAPASRSRPYLSASLAAKLDTLNSAVALTGPARDFLTLAGD